LAPLWGAVAVPGVARRVGGTQVPNDLVQAWNAVVAQLAEDGLDSVFVGVPVFGAPTAELGD